MKIEEVLSLKSYKFYELQNINMISNMSHCVYTIIVLKIVDIYLTLLNIQYAAMQMVPENM